MLYRRSEVDSTYLESLGGDLEITDNPDLPTSIAQAFADRLRANGFAGQITISGNKDG